MRYFCPIIRQVDLIAIRSKENIIFLGLTRNIISTSDENGE